MKKCVIEVVPSQGGISIWCVTCCENVAWGPDFTVAEVVATASGHRKVMKEATEASVRK